jgi:hypothetical protein
MDRYDRYTGGWSDLQLNNYKIMPVELILHYSSLHIISGEATGNGILSDTSG